MVARGQRAYKAGIPVALVIATMRNDLVARINWISGVAYDVAN
jgi:hypothetical protein